MSEENNRVVELTQKVEELKDKASRSKRPMSEATVISARVMPILNILGWDSEETNAVVREYSVRGYKDKRADIALGENMEESDGKVLVFIEAKASKESLHNGKYISQLEDYCLKQHVDLGVLTNGTKWDFYLYPRGAEPLLAEEIDMENSTETCVSKFVQILSHKHISEKRHLQFANKAAFCRLTDQVWEILLKDRKDIRGLVQRHLSKKRGKPVAKKEEKKWLEEWLEDKITELHSVASEGRSEESVTSIKSESDAKPKDKPSKAAASKVTHIVAFGEQIEVEKFTEAQLAFLQKLESEHPGSLERLAQEPRPVCFKNTNQMREKGVPKQIGNMPYWAEMHRSAVAHRQTCHKALKALGLPLGSIRFFNGDHEYKD